MHRRRQGSRLIPNQLRGAYPLASAARRLPLDAWLAIRPSARSDGVADTVLRTMASNFGLMRGLAAVCLGTAAILLAATTLAALTDLHTWALGLLLAAAVLGVCGLVTLCRVRGTPSTSLGAYRGAGTVRSGVAAGLMIGAMLSVVALPLTVPLFQGGPADAAVALMLHVLILAQVLCVFAVPAWFVQHAVRDFRAAILGDPALYAELDHLSRTWDEPYGTREFGPL